MQSRCYHCDLENPADAQYQFEVLGESREFCCPGCLAIAETIVTSGMQDFYRFRSESNNKAEEILPEEILELEAFDTPAIRQSIVEDDEQQQSIELGIEGITCAACGWLINKQISQRPEVISIQVNTTTRRALLKFSKDSNLSPILLHIRELGYRAFPFSEDEQEKSLQKEDQQFSRRLIVSGLAMMQVMMFATGLYLGGYDDISKEHAYFLHWVSGLLATPVVFYSAIPFFKSAWHSLKNRHFGMNLPVSIAILAGYTASVYSLLTHGDVYYFDSVVMFTFFLLVGRYLEHRMRLKAVLKQQNFKRLIPYSVNRRLADGEMEVIPVSEVAPGDKLVVNAGQVIPVDGILLDQKADINESVITGEFLPVSKQYHDPLFSGSTNTGASLHMQAEKDLKNCRIQQLVQLQSHSENLDSARVTLADKIANYYVIILLLLSLLAGVYWWYVEPQKVFPVILSMLVVSCPCALSLATPAAVAAAISRLTDSGLMVKTSNTLSDLAKVTDVFFDKTGTLTLGRMQLLKTECQPDVTEAEALAIARQLESVSKHPIAHAFESLSSNEKFEHLVLPKTPKFEQIVETIAGGISAQTDKDRYAIGKLEYVSNKENPVAAFAPEKATALGANVIVYLTKNSQLLASFLLSDSINPTAKSAVVALQKDHIATAMLTGDSAAAAAAINRNLALEKVFSDCSPEDKLQQIESAQKDHKTVLMVGDGVNDIGALNSADVSITMGAASHLSRASSNAVLVSHDLTVIQQSIKLAQRLERIIRQNLSWAVAYNLVAIPFAMAGLVPAWLAAIGMTTSSLVVVLNALRLRR